MMIAKDQLCALASRYGTPLFVYDAKLLRQRAGRLTSLAMPYGLTVRYAVKANTHPEIITLFDKAGLTFDASSSYEAEVLLGYGISGEKISLSSQQPAHNLPKLLDGGVRYVATSLHQLRLFAEAAPKGSSLALRVNPGLGAGHNNRTTTGGANSSFGLWYAYVPDALDFAAKHDLVIDRLHVHIGSGADPKMWEEVLDVALTIASSMPDVKTLDIGGGFKIRRFGDEREANMEDIGEAFSNALQRFAAETGRELHLEIEPGTWLVGPAGVLLSEVVDKVDTGPDGHQFLRLNTGMNDIIRPSMYGAQHRIEILNNAQEKEPYVVVGHNCETGDLLTPAFGDPESLEPRELARADIGDVVAIYDAGAYCASFAVHGYNAFPSAKEVMIEKGEQ